MTTPKVSPKLTVKSAFGLVARRGVVFFHDLCRLFRALARQDSRYYLCAVATVKNEAPYIREWIEYHRLVGFDKFVIYDNESDDNLREVLEHYAGTDLVTYIRWPGKGQQIAIYNHALSSFGRFTRWMSMIDLDEFIYPVMQDSVADVMRDYEAYGGIAANWVMFDANDHDSKPDGLVVDAYRRRQPLSETSRVIKTIFNPCYAYRFENPHIPEMIFQRYVLNQAYEPLAIPYNYNLGATDRLRIFHYWTKSREEFQRKIERGRADFSNDRKRDFEQCRYMLKFDSFEIENGMDRFIPALKQRLSNGREEAL